MKKKDTADKRGKKAFGTREWAAHNVNLQSGCEHDCLYCFAHGMSAQYGRAAAKNWSGPSLRRIFALRTAER